MTKKDEFSDLAKDLDRKFKALEEKKKKFDDNVKRVDAHQKAKRPEEKTDKFKEQKEMQKYDLKQRLTTAFVVFIICQMLLIPICLRYPGQFLAIWLVGTFSICIICVAVIDLSP